jgi:RNA polymerase sigma factor (sigma-70 family)
MRIVSSSVVMTLRAIFEDGSASILSDDQLLERFLCRRDEAAELAFALLVRRHGPMVLRVCRAILREPHDADDAFQATFLVLARKARAIRKRDSLASFLHGVSLRAARDIRAASIRRRKHEGLVALRSTSTEDGAVLDNALHEELAQLPERYRTPIILCELEGLSCEEAAARLRCPVGTIKSRLSRGRDRLRARLVRRGVTLGAALATATLVPEALAESTARGARSFAVGSTSEAVASRVVRSLAAAKIGAIMALLVTVGIVTALVATGIPGAPTAQAPGEKVAPEPRQNADHLTVDVRENDKDDLPGEITGPSQDEIAALIKRIGRDKPTPELVAQITSFFRPRIKQGSHRWETLKRRVTDPSFVERMDAVAGELTGKPADTRNLTTRALGDHVGRQDALHRAEMRDDLARCAEPPKTLRGRVVDEQDNPIPGVFVSTWGALAKSDAQGEFAMQVQRPRFFSDRPFAKLYLEAMGCGLSEANFLWDEIKEGDAYLYRILRQSACDGRVVDRGGKPIEGAELDLWVDRAVIVRDGSLDRINSGGDGEILKARTDTQGQFAFRGLPSRDNAIRYLIVLAVHHPRFEPNEYRFEPNEQPQSGMELILSPGCTIAGTVRDAADRPVANAWVQLGRTQTSNHRPQTFTDTRGRFRFDNLSPGEWTVLVQPELQATVVAVASASHETPVDLQIAAPAGGYLAGKVIGPDGMPAANAAVGWLVPVDDDDKPTNAPGGARITHTLSDGSFRLGPVPEGRYKILGLIDPPRSEAYVVGKTGQNDLLIRHEPAAK